MTNHFDKIVQKLLAQNAAPLLPAKATAFSTSAIFFSVAFVEKSVALIFFANAFAAIASAPLVSAAKSRVRPHDAGDRGRKWPRMAKKR